MVMVAFGTSEPLGSVTVPTIVPSCAKVRSVKVKRKIEHSAGKRQSLQLLGDRNARDLIVFLQNFCSERNLRHRRAVMQKGTVVKPEHARMATRIPRHETLQARLRNHGPMFSVIYQNTAHRKATTWARSGKSAAHACGCQQKKRFGRPIFCTLNVFQPDPNKS